MLEHNMVTHSGFPCMNRLGHGHCFRSMRERKIYTPVLRISCAHTHVAHAQNC